VKLSSPAPSSAVEERDRSSERGDDRRPGQDSRGVGGAGGGRPQQRVLVVYSEGRLGEAALREGAELAAAGADLVVVTLAPQAKTLKCCKGGGAGPYNCAIREVAKDELRQARELLGSLAARTHYTTLKGTPFPPLAEWSAAQGFDVVILVRERFSRGGGRLARELRAASDADVRLVG
jgi:hypothetical protein